ncbi:hypothetical protein CYLTODRAFT_418541 [Cylindrobasidium torrendii FP15055 ss-10]|uniref:Uncharacterized protein n=1 Tax=Cylindrobasidium torrendii FP15055 ss-10 TaxID=1314674 RepID=A0A0D7BMP6_9AGAR|nr:hypothetical protein CYLTODRAFT_418541 [Cylindrobasidium torrendii FP15055 ss-10]
MQVESHEIQAQHRFESFKLGKPRPMHAHARSHSRNASLSSFTFGASKSTPASLNDTPEPTPSTSPEPAPAPTALSAAAKRNSHHRRRSSVSTRRESADLMGVEVSQQDDSQGGDKDAIRRHALWALEGKTDSKVEIPDIMSSDGGSFEFPSKPSFPPGLGISGKRDSFKLLSASSSSKDQLHTLLEEDEDEEEAQSPAPVAAPKPMARPRPATLTLRPVSPESDNAFGLPTPPSAPRRGLRTLSLASNSSSDSSTSSPTLSSTKRPSLSLQIAADGSLVKSPETKPTKRSSICYKRSSTSSVGAGLPTPAMTPVSDRHRSLSSIATDDDDYSLSSASSYSFRNQSQTRPLSVSEQHFLFKSHNALLARIMDLERSLSHRRDSLNSRPSSFVSDTSNSSSVDDEMINLVRDLKSERDELKRDCEGWRQRVAEMDNQVSTLGKRVENERREAWVARTKHSAAETERVALTGQVQSLTAEVAQLKSDNTSLHAEVDTLAQENRALKDQLASLRETQSTMSTSGAAAWSPLAPKRVSVDSSFPTPSSSTMSQEAQFGQSVRTVNMPFGQGEYFSSDEDDCLAGYEDEDEGDFELSDGPVSDDDLTEEYRRPSFAAPSLPPPPPTLVLPTTPAHQARASLSKTWTFPRGPHANRISESTSDVDRFFGCLDENDESPAMSPIDTEEHYSFERSKSLFSSGFMYDEPDTDMPTWLLSAGPVATGGHVPDDQRSLEVVLEEEEDDLDEEGSEATKVDDDDDDMFGDIGGIKITFTPPSDDPTPKSFSFGSNILPETPKAKDYDTPIFEEPSPCIRTESAFGSDMYESDEDNFTAFNFGRPAMATPPAVRSRSPSGIPRAVRSPSPSSPTNNGATTPPRRAPSFIPQPKPRPSTTASFIRQPTRKPLTSSQNFQTNGSTPAYPVLNFRMPLHRS